MGGPKMPPRSSRSGGSAMRTLLLRVSALVLVAVLVLAVAVVALGAQAKVTPANGGAVPDVQCPSGVSPAEVFCYATSVPVPGAPKPSQIGVPQAPGSSAMPYVDP
jgi:hypothetical protein